MQSRPLKRMEVGAYHFTRELKSLPSLEYDDMDADMATLFGGLAWDLC